MENFLPVVSIDNVGGRLEDSGGRKWTKVTIYKTLEWGRKTGFSLL
jgi:hypothetical protein